MMVKIKKKKPTKKHFTLKRNLSILKGFKFISTPLLGFVIAFRCG